MSQKLFLTVHIPLYYSNVTQTLAMKMRFIRHLCSLVYRYTKTVLNNINFVRKLVFFFSLSEIVHRNHYTFLLSGIVYIYLYNIILLYLLVFCANMPRLTCLRTSTRGWLINVRVTPTWDKQICNKKKAKNKKKNKRIKKKTTHYNRMYFIHKYTRCCRHPCGQVRFIRSGNGIVWLHFGTLKRYTFARD